VNAPRPGDGTPLLEVTDLVVHHGQLRALDRVSLRVFPGEVYAIIGANGAGKSTLLRTIAGLHQPTEGTILYDGKDMTKVRPERRATAGVLPNSSATARITAASSRRRAVFDVGSRAMANASAASTVPCHVRRSLTLKSSPTTSRNRVLRSSACTSHQPSDVR